MVLLVRCFLSVFFLLLVSALDLDVYPMANPKSNKSEFIAITATCDWGCNSNPYFGTALLTVTMMRMNIVLLCEYFISNLFRTRMRRLIVKFDASDSGHTDNICDGLSRHDSTPGAA